MPWVEALLRGQKVIARAKADGSLASEGGRVEIRYKRTDPRAYRAGVANLEIVKGTPLLDDDAVVPGEAAPSKQDKKDARAKTAAAKAEAVPRPPGAWIVYTDGACSGNPGPAGAGLVVVAPDGKIQEGFKWLGVATNNIAELTAVLLALHAVPRDAPAALIHTDSQYAIGVLTKGWKAKANQELIAEIKTALRPWGDKVRFVYVPGHSGVPMNERADELAREAIRTSASRSVP